MLETQLSDLFDSESAEAAGQSLQEAIAEEWDERHHMPLAQVPAAWRFERRLYQVTMPADGYFVDICRSDSLAAIYDVLGSEVAGRFNVEELTVESLLSQNRALTTRIAAWVYSLVLDDGSLPHGIQYPSKHGTDFMCRAMWLRRSDDGKPRSEPVKADQGQDILDPDHNPPYQTTLRKFGLKGF